MKRLVTSLGLLAVLIGSLAPFANRVQADPPEAAQAPPAITIARRGSQPSQPGPAEYFTGSVHVTLLFKAETPSHTSGGSVTFEPGARSAWHTHPLGQVLVVTAGTGWVQSWGGPLQEMRAGDVVRIPPGVKHWHGATATSSVTHLAL